MCSILPHRVIRCALLLALLGAAAPAAVPAARAQYLTPMPEPRAGAAAAVVGGKIFVIGGEDARGRVLDSMVRYDPKTDTWETNLPAPDEGRVHAAAVVVDGKIYLLGGRDADGRPTNDVEVFDPRTGRWTEGESMRRRRVGLAAVVIGRRIFAIGGLREDGSVDAAVEYYDVPEAGTPDDASDDDEGDWQVLDGWTFRTALGGLAAVTLDDAIYTFGGVSLFGPLNLVQRYRPGEGALEFNAPRARGWLQAVALKRRIYVIGGYSPATSGPLPDVERFDPETRRWQLETLLATPRWDHVAVAIGREIFVMGGRGPRGNRDVLASVELITPTGVAVEPGETPAASMGLDAYPTPFRARVDLRFLLPQPAPVHLAVYDLHGRRIATLHDAYLPAGTHTLAWSGERDGGGTAPAGVYLARLQAGSEVLSTTLVRVR